MAYPMWQNSNNNWGANTGAGPMGGASGGGMNPMMALQLASMLGGIFNKDDEQKQPPQQQQRRTMDYPTHSLLGQGWYWG